MSACTRDRCRSSRSLAALFTALVGASCSLETEATGLPWSNDPSQGDPDDDGMRPSDEDVADEDADDRDDDQPQTDAAVLDDATAMDDGRRTPDARSDDAAKSDAAPPREVCTRAGTFAIRLDFDVTWLGTSFAGIVPVVAPGSGRMTMYAVAEFRADGLQNGAVRACGAQIPDFEAGQNPWAGEVYGAYIPNSAWDQSSMPTWAASFRVDCDRPGCAFTTTPIDALLGIRPLTGGPRGGWQQRRGNSMMTTPFVGVDDDADGSAGLTLLTRHMPELDGRGRPYTQPPLGNWFSRANKLMLGIGVHVQLAGKFDSCDQQSGRLSASTVDTVALGCSSMSGVTEIPCDPGAVNFLEQNLPVWTVTSANFKARRVSSVSCEGVRKLLE